MKTSEVDDTLGLDVSKDIEMPVLIVPKVCSDSASLFAHIDNVAKNKDIFAEQKRRAWDNTTEARYDFTYRLRLTRRSDVNFISIWQKSVYGQTLTEIKGNENMIEFFAQSIVPVIREMLGYNLHHGDCAICTTPKRRHLTKNFATLISERIATQLDIPFYEDVAFCHSKHRVGAVFNFGTEPPKERNVTVFDDFVMSSTTMISMKNLLEPLGYNLVFFTGIKNKL